MHGVHPSVKTKWSVPFHLWSLLFQVLHGLTQAHTASRSRFLGQWTLPKATCSPKPLTRPSTPTCKQRQLGFYSPTPSGPSRSIIAEKANRLLFLTRSEIILKPKNAAGAAVYYREWNKASTSGAMRKHQELGGMTKGKLHEQFKQASRSTIIHTHTHTNTKVKW